MLVTVENQLATSINYPAVGEDGIAVGGGNHPEETTHRVHPIPYPFDLVGTLTANGTPDDQVTLAMHPQDLRYSRSQMDRGLPVSEKWTQIIQAGVVTMALAAQPNLRNPEELFVAAV